MRSARRVGRTVGRPMAVSWGSRSSERRSPAYRACLNCPYHPVSSANCQFQLYRDRGGLLDEVPCRPRRPRRRRCLGGQIVADPPAGAGPRGILLEVRGSTLTVAGFDYEVSTRATVSVDTLDSFPDADDDAEAPAQRVLVSGRLLAEITRALPGKPVDLAVVGPRVSIVAGSARFTLPTMPVEDYPPLPQMPSSSGTVDSAVFAEAVAQTAVAAGRDDTLPMLTGIRVEIEGETLTLAATDRFRLAVRELSWLPDQPDLNTAVLVPARTLADAAKTLGGAAKVTIALGDGLLGLEAGGRRTTVRLLDVEFVKY